MVLNEIELEEQLKEAGNRLLDSPSSLEELLHLLDILEHLLVNVDQAPSRSMQDALLPPMKALISNALLRNSDVDVKVSVASCLSEITRITAPESPYNDAHMKEIFQLIVASMEKLSHVSSRSCTKAASILETIAKVRLCLLMLDLELDELIVKMFKHFLKIIRSNHSHTIFLAMETIMTLIIDESDNISKDLLTSLLASVRKDKQSVYPFAWKLGEKVITNCAAKLKPYLNEVFQFENIAKDDYASVVASVCGDKSLNFEHDHCNGSANCLAMKGQSPSAASPGEVFQAVKGISNSISNTSGSTRDVPDHIQNNSLKILEHCSIIEKSESTDANQDADPAIYLERELEPFPRKRGRKPNSLMNPEEGYDHSWISKGRKTAKLSSGRKPRNKGLDVHSEKALTKKEILSVAHVTELTELSPKTDGMSGGSQAKKGSAKRSSTDASSLRLDKEEAVDSAHEEKSRSEDEVDLRRGNEEIKHQKQSRKIKCAAKTSKGRSMPSGYVSSGKAVVQLGLEGKPQQKSTKKGLRNISKDSSLAKTDMRKRKLAVDDSDVDVTEASRKIKSCDRDEISKEENPQTNLKKKRTPRKEVLPSAFDIGPKLVGRRVKIWWPLDTMFYEAVIESYNHIKRKHRVLYADGDEEILNLRKERWELIEDDILSDKEAKTDTREADSSSDKWMIRAKKGKQSIKSGLAKQLKVDAKRCGSTSISKRKAKISGNKSTGRNTRVASVANKTMGDSITAGTGLKGEIKSCGGHLKIKSEVKTEQITPENSSSCECIVEPSRKK